jgi:hypothetical protein
MLNGLVGIVASHSTPLPTMLAMSKATSAKGEHRLDCRDRFTYEKQARRDEQLKAGFRVRMIGASERDSSRQATNVISPVARSRSHFHLVIGFYVRVRRIVPCGWRKREVAGAARTYFPERHNNAEESQMLPILLGNVMKIRICTLHFCQPD